jgi:hypothetical protein
MSIAAFEGKIYTAGSKEVVCFDASNGSIVSLSHLE